MMYKEFEKFVAEFKSRPIPGKHVYIWNGDKDSLLEILGKNQTEEIDLCLYMNTDADLLEDNVNALVVRKQIEKTLEHKLFELYSDVQKRGKQQILVVLSPSILARYKIGLTVFYNYYLGDHTMVIFVVPIPKFQNDLKLPEYVRYDPNETLKYISSLTQPENVIEVK